MKDKDESGGNNVARVAARRVEERLGQELDRRLKRFANSLLQGTLDGIQFRDGQLHIAAVTASTPAPAPAFSAKLDGMLPRARIIEILHG